MKAQSPGYTIWALFMYRGGWSDIMGSTVARAVGR